MIKYQMETVSIMQRVYGRHVRVPFKYKHVADASEMGVNPSWVARRVVTQGITGLDIEQ
jgi:hypothetical protein